MFVALFIKNAACVCPNSNLNQGRSFDQQPLISEIKDCFFNRFQNYNGGPGGVICFMTVDANMSIINSMFFNCRVVNPYWQYGGAVFFNCSNGQSSLNMVCASNCGCGYIGQFGYIKASVSNINHINYLSINKCCNESIGYYPLHISDGHIKNDNSNYSLNRAFHSSAILVSFPTSMTSSYCTYSNNIASSSVTIWLQSNSGSVTYNNIVGNNSPGYSVVLVHESAYSFSHCVFFKNTNTLLSTFISGSLYVTNSYISHSDTITGGSVITSNNNVFTLTMSHPLTLYSSYYCNADIPFFLNEMNSNQTIPRTFDERCSIVESLQFQSILHVFNFVCILS